MSTRKVAISNDHVNAINLIEVDFYECAEVEAAWRTYKNHLNDNSRPEDDAWRDKRDNLLRLLFEMGKVLGFDIPAIEIFQGGYAPGGWAYRENRASAVMEYLFALSGKECYSNERPQFPRGRGRRREPGRIIQVAGRANARRQSLASLNC